MNHAQAIEALNRASEYLEGLGGIYSDFLGAIAALATPQEAAPNRRIPFGGFDPKFCPGSNPESPQEAAPVTDYESKYATAERLAKPAATATCGFCAVSPGELHAFDCTALDEAAPVTGEAIAWESTTPYYVKFITDARYQLFSPEVRRWYKPYRCTNCATPADESGQVAEQKEALRLADMFQQFVIGEGAWERFHALTLRAEAAERAREESEQEAATERALQRAAGELPEGWQVCVFVERGSGWVQLIDPDEEDVEFERSDRNMAEQIDEAISAAFLAANDSRGQASPK